ncbi:MAG: hydantoinase B/oxoprolinase family protein [Steroidobacteraceae bacterium]|nr:hydantoinase B/oxoprolinase family protein [Steroidobacteraceae bacterium]
MTRAQPGHGWRIAIDRGGTFTDIVATGPDGTVHTHKVLSRDPAHPGDPAVRGMDALLQRLGAAHAPIESVRLGTTVATNALLERRGEPTLLVVTRGLRDVLRIGHQHRPDIFARAIRLPAMLYSQVVEVRERLAADGSVLEALDEAELSAALGAARRSGLRAVAIAFLHAVRNAAHERRAAELARAAGFEEVVASHAVAPIMGLIARGDSAVADAYLSPVLLRHLQTFRAELAAQHGAPPLLAMQSNGGLVDPDGFRGINGVLSGPAGGVVGLAAAGTMAGHDRLIGFDMGGTSTDVSLYAGELPRRYSTEIDGVRLQTPMMDIHTIAAGGGSIVRYADGRLQAGPESAGADPGPACYRRGGPATITDCNVVLGRIQADRFPGVFGPAGDSPLDPQASRTRLAEIAGQVAAAGGPQYTVESLAAAFIEVAVAKTANAIRELALRHGEDTQRFALVPFGGAAGQHACAVAELLGIDTLLFHPLAGVLSAWGIGMAQRRCIRRRSVEARLDPTGMDAAQGALHAISLEARSELARQRVAPDAIGERCVAHLRLAGSDSSLELPWRDESQLRDAFRQAHERLYGFAAEEQALHIAAVSVEAIELHAAGLSPPGLPAPAAVTPGPATPTAPAWIDDAWRAIPLHAREALRVDESIVGPALLSEHGATGWIAPGWVATTGADGALRVQRVARADARTGVTTGAPDPLRLEIFNGLFMHVAEQMGVVLRQTASSVNIKERLDYSCALFDGMAQLVANAPHMPVHLGSMGASVAAVIDAHGADLQPGDAFLLNSPYHGGTHLPDLTVVTPVFDPAGERVHFFTASRAHHADIGGTTPGSMPPGSSDIAEEGVLIEPTRIVRNGRFAEDDVRRLLAAGRWPARNVGQNLADLRAQLAANARGIRELERAAAAHGWPTLLTYMGHVQDNAEACMRRAIRRLDCGRFRYEMDNGQSIAVEVTVDRHAGTAVVDFTGTSPQQANNLNAPRAVTIAAVLYVFRTLIEEPIPLNAGCLRPLVIVVPPGSLLDPAPPGAVVAGNVETSQCIVDALYGALGVQAAAQGTMNNFTFGNDRYQYYETIAGGAGAGPGYDGASGVQTHMTNSRLTDPEVLEGRFPVLLREFSLRTGSGGAGAFRGGDGVVREVEFREPMTAGILANHRRVAPFGLAGGGPGRVGRNTVLRRDGRSETLQATAELAVDAGDRLRIETPGGGAYGAAVGRHD